MYKRVGWWILRIIGGIGIGVAVAFLFGWLVMLLWNWLMPAIFGLGPISFWKAWGLVILAHLLFKSGQHHPSPHHFHDSCHSAWKKRFENRIRDHKTGEGEPAEEKPV
jgi:hypothetical protein